MASMALPWRHNSTNFFPSSNVLLMSDLLDRGFVNYGYRFLADLGSCLVTTAIASWSIDADLHEWVHFFLAWAALETRRYSAVPYGTMIISLTIPTAGSPAL